MWCWCKKPLFFYKSHSLIIIIFERKILVLDMYILIFSYLINSSLCEYMIYIYILKIQCQKNKIKKTKTKYFKKATI